MTSDGTCLQGWLYTLLETLRTELGDAEIDVVGDAFAPLLAEADVANALLGLARDNRAGIDAWSAAFD